MSKLRQALAHLQQWRHRCGHIASRFWNVRRSALALLVAATSASAFGQVQYIYDELGRLVEAVAPGGASVQYQYDAAGNITLVRRSAATALSLTEFTPNAGPVGTSVTIYGSGFVATVAGNTVKFNGTTATVSAATANRLTVAVPAGATTGKVSVTNTNGTVTSADNYVVGVALAAPTVSGFAPGVGKVGTVVSLSGTNFQLAVEDNKVSTGFHGMQAIADATSPTATSLKAKVLSNFGWGKLRVTTPYGTGVSAADFYAVPDPYQTGDVQVTGRLALGGPGITVSITAANKIAMLLFDGVQGQTGVHLEMSAVTIAAGTASVLAPDGSVVRSAAISSGAVSLPALPMAGTYAVLLSTGTSVGSATLRLGTVDLAISELAVGTIVANASGSWSIPISYKVTNVGTVAAQPDWYDVPYLSTDGNLDNADLPLASRRTMSALSPGAFYSVTNTIVTTSTTTAPGTYTLFVKTDGHGATSTGSGTATDSGNLYEGTETNNVAAVSVTLNRPDLSISNLTAGAVVANPNGSWSIPITYTVTNVGLMPAQPDWYDVPYLSIDATLDNADAPLVSQRRMSALAPGGSYTFTNTIVTTSTTTAPGTYTLFVKTDGHGATSTGSGTATDSGNLAEASENNNVAPVSVTLSRPDLAISGFTVGTIVANANGSWSIPVSYMVTNVGTATAQPDWYDVPYLSANGTLDNADPALGITRRTMAALGPGASYTVTNTIVTTSTSAAVGNYTLFVKVDGHNASSTGSGTNTDNGYLVEASEANNVVSRVISLVR
jgi:YD repeat-containing protein